MHASTVSAILSTVQNTLSTQGLSCVTIVGHSLGGEHTLLDGVFFSLQLSKDVTVKVISYGMPHVGNQAFANFVDRQLSRHVTHVYSILARGMLAPVRFVFFFLRAFACGSLD